MSLRSLDRVRFDFFGALKLARELWQLADSIESSRRQRDSHAATALRAWAGPLRNTFLESATTESQNSATVVGLLREEANAWARLWASAMDEQNRRNRAAKERTISAERSVGEQFIDLFKGDDSGSHLASAPVAAIPQPPGFVATQREVFF